MPAPEDPVASSLELVLLGPMEVRRDGRGLDLPQSKKTRGLLAYLAVTARRHRRDSLCTLLWDVTDDPRGALRWSLSKLRRVVDRSGSEDERVIVADRDSVGLDLSAVRVDVRELLRGSRDPGSAATEQLERLAELSRGEFLEGLELADFHDFHAWCVSMREEVRERRGAVLSTLAPRLRDDPRRALPHVRDWVRFDPLSVQARTALLEVLLAQGKSQEAHQTFELGCRVLRDLDAASIDALKMRWRELTRRASVAGSSLERERAEPEPTSSPPLRAEAPSSVTPVRRPDRMFVGRTTERETLMRLLEQARTRGNLRVALISGEPGAGKSRLAEMIVEAASRHGMTVLHARAFDAQLWRPFGPWADALAECPGVEVLSVLDASVSPGQDDPSSREAVFAAVAETVVEATQPSGALVVLDDVQWLDRDSAELLQYVARVSVQRPLFVLLGARSGELADNEAMLQVLRSLRRDTRVDDLVRDRLDRLPSDAGEVLRWSSVLGNEFDISRLERLSSLSMEAMVDALELLERHTLVSAVTGKGGMRYRFAHDVVREAIYAELSQPRRRLMHRRVAQLLEPQMNDPSIATEVARHASLGRDAALGVDACIRAGRRSLRVFASADAEALARRGLHLLEDLGESDRIAQGLELLQVLWSAREPDRGSAAERVRALTDRALALGLSTAARLGFHMLAHLEWEQGSMAEATGT